MTGLDYADQRFYASTYGRFNTPDPARQSAVLREPGSWNRYEYTYDDPINRSDPSGLTSCDANGENCYDSVSVTEDEDDEDDSDVSFSQQSTHGAAPSPRQFAIQQS
jgi:RHS repeat-associated protein